MSKLLLDERPLLILPGLAEKIGLNEAIILQQIHYWTEKDKIGKVHEGRRWVRNTYKQWQDNFPFWSQRTIRRTLNNLRDMGLIDVARLNRFDYDKTNWYAINREQVAKLEQDSDEKRLDKMTSGSDRLDKMTSTPGQNDQIDLDKMTRPIPETTAKTTTYISNDEKSANDNGNGNDQEPHPSEVTEPELEGDALLDSFGLGKAYQEKHGPNSKKTNGGNGSNGPDWRDQQEQPWATWGQHSETAGKYLERQGARAGLIQQLGYEIEHCFHLAPDWKDKQDVKHWFDGLVACLDKTNDQPTYVLQAARHLAESDGIIIASPWSLVKTARAFTAKAKTRPNAPRRRAVEVIR